MDYQEIRDLIANARKRTPVTALLRHDEPLPLEDDADLQVYPTGAGTTILVGAQNVERALSISDRAYIMDQGLIVHADTAANLLADPAIQDRYCAV